MTLKDLRALASVTAVCVAGWVLLGAVVVVIVKWVI